MNYPRLLAALESASRTLPPATPPVEASQIPAWVESLPLREMQQADRVCEQFASTRQWPAVPSVIAAQIHLRLAAATDLCRMAMEQRQRTTPLPDQDALRLLLVDFWHGQGADWARRRYGHLWN